MEYSLLKVADIVSGELIGGGEMVVTSIATDSRNRADGIGVMFVAIKGVTHDGHKFVGDLVGRGVRCFMVEQREVITKELLEMGACFVLVNDAVDALQKLASYHRRAFKGIVVGVTGSNGKTVVKEWVSQLWLEENGRLFRSPRSYNSQLGVALSLLMIRGDERVAVVEAGISRVGEMERLERMIRPDVGLITNIGAAHGENFESMEQKMAEKLRLFRHTKTVIYNGDDRLLKRVLTGGDAFGAKEVAFHGDDSSPWMQNRAAVLALYDVLGLSHRGIECLADVAMRLDVQQGAMDSVVINDSYNSDLISLQVALDYQRSMNTGSTQKALIISDILQTGISDKDLYRTVSVMVRSYNIDNFVGIGSAISACRHLFDGGRFFDTTDQFLTAFRIADFAGQCVLVKGSRMYGFERISAVLAQKTHTTTLTVNLGAMAHNLNYYRGKLAAGVRTMAMVKAHSYGSGDVEVASMLQFQKVDYLAVAFADEGVTLRTKGGITLPIIVLNADPSSFDTMIEHSLEPEIYSISSLRSYIDQLARFNRWGEPIHIKLDTGMHRLGFMASDMERLCEVLERSGGVVRVASVFSHLSASEDPGQDDFTRSQIALFSTMCEFLASRLGYRPLGHICNSAAIERFPEAHMDMVRLGIGLYYGGGSTEVVSSLQTRIVQIKNVPQGDTIGYGRRGRADRLMRLAIVPIGYADGLDRRLGCGVAQMVIRGVRCPIVGNICMDTCMLDISALGGDVAEGELVEVFGTTISVQELSDKMGTIPYEILTSISSRIKRIYTNEL